MFCMILPSWSCTKDFKYYKTYSNKDPLEQLLGNLKQYQNQIFNKSVYVTGNFLNIKHTTILSNSKSI